MTTVIIYASHYTKKNLKYMSKIGFLRLLYFKDFCRNCVCFGIFNTFKLEFLEKKYLFNITSDMRSII